MRLLVATAFLILAGASGAQAQRMGGLPDFTTTDLGSLYGGWVADNDAAMGGATDGLVAGNLADPEAVAVMRSGACGAGTPEELALAYAATGGCTRQGYGTFNRDTEALIARDRAFRGGL